MIDILHILKSKSLDTSKKFKPTGIFERIDNLLKFYSRKDLIVVRTIIEKFEINIYFPKTKHQTMILGNKPLVFISDNAFWFNLPEKLYDQIYDFVPHKKFVLTLEILAMVAINSDYKNYRSYRNEINGNEINGFDLN